MEQEARGGMGSLGLLERTRYLEKDSGIHMYQAPITRTFISSLFNRMPPVVWT